MTTNFPTPKSLVIVGSNDDMTTGALLYKLGGIDLPMLAKLQDKGINSYAEAAQELKKTSEELYFYTPQYRVTVKDKLPSPDGLLLIVTSPSQTSENLFTKNTIDRLKVLEPLFAQRKAVILVKLPEDLEWSENVFDNLAQKIGATLQELNIQVGSTPMIPSDLQGENFIELSSRTPWHTQSTLVAALDKTFSQAVCVPT